MKQPTELYLVVIEKAARGEEDVPILERRRLPFHQFTPVTKPESAEALREQALENFSLYTSDQQPLIVSVRKYQLDGEMSFLCKRPG